MADFTTTYAVTNLAEVPVTCHIEGAKRIVVQENFNSSSPPTADLLQRGGAQGSAQINVPKGTPAVFTGPDSGGFNFGQQVGTIETAAGSITVLQLESVRL